MEAAETIERFSTQDLMDVLFFIERWTYWTGGLEGIGEEEIAVTIANEVRHRTLRARRDDLSQEERLRAPAFILHRAAKDPRELKILDPACGSGHLLLYCYDLLETIYEEEYDDERRGQVLREAYPDRDEYLRAIPDLILRHNLHGIDIDLRATQIAAFALWLRAQRSYGNLGIKNDAGSKIARSNIVCAEPMPGERDMLGDFIGALEPGVLAQVVEVVFDNLVLAGEAGSLLKVEEEIKGAIARAKAQWQREFDRATDTCGNELLLMHLEMDRLSSRTDSQENLFDVSWITDAEFWDRAAGQVTEALEAYARRASGGTGYQRSLFAEDAARGFAFIRTCQERFDVVLMNPPFGKVSKPSKPYIEKYYPRTKNDVYAAFVECGLGWLHPGGFLGAITSRTGFSKPQEQAATAVPRW